MKLIVNHFSENIKIFKLNNCPNDRIRNIIFKSFWSLKKIFKQNSFDIVFMDAPYKTGQERDVLVALKNGDIIDKYTIIIIEEALDTDLSYVSELGYEIYKEKRYKTNKHVFLRIGE